MTLLHDPVGESPKIECSRCALPGSWRNEERWAPRLYPVLVEDLDLHRFIGPPVLLCGECMRYCREQEDRRLEAIDWTTFLVANSG